MRDAIFGLEGRMLSIEVMVVDKINTIPGSLGRI